VLSVQQDIQQRAAALRSGSKVSADARAAQLAALAQEANTKLESTLGARGLEAYKNYGGGWMQILQPPRTRPPVTVVPPKG